MTVTQLPVGFIPLVDAAPYIIAHHMGFAEEEGLELDLRKAPSWSTLRDQLVLGQVDAAHMLAPIPVAMALGLGGMTTQTDALLVSSVNGNAIGVSRTIADRLRDRGYTTNFQDAAAAGQALSALDGELRIGVPFPYSMHAELVQYWLDAFGISATQAVNMRTIPPQLMAEAIQNDEVDVFCVGEPWGSLIVEQGCGELLLPSRAIWQFAPEKVLAVRHDWAEDNPSLTGRLMRAIWRASRWLGNPEHLSATAEILSKPAYLGVNSDLIERSLTGRMFTSQNASTHYACEMVTFSDGASSFPWKSQGAWIASRLAHRFGLDPAQSIQAATDVFRSDLYRQHLESAGADMPGASEKLEGSLQVPTPVASVGGTLILPPDCFFDGQIFDPSLQN